MILCAVMCFSAVAASNDDQPEEQDRELSTITSDRDNDGTVDYVLQFDEEGTKVYEELDFNYDGVMDDFYYYSSGILSRREIDTNYDEEVDVWVYIHQGVYIERYERDLDFDGRIDQVKDFAEPAAQAKK